MNKKLINVNTPLIYTPDDIEKAKDEKIRAFMQTPESLACMEEEYKRAMTAVLAKRMKEIRKAKGFTQQTLADLMGVKQPEIVRLEKGKSSMQIKTLFSFLRAVNGKCELIY